MKNVILVSPEAWNCESKTSMHTLRNGGSMILRNSCRQWPNLRVVENLHENKHWRYIIVDGYNLLHMKLHCKWVTQNTRMNINEERSFRELWEANNESLARQTLASLRMGCSVGFKMGFKWDPQSSSFHLDNNDKRFRV